MSKTRRNRKLAIETIEPRMLLAADLGSGPIIPPLPPGGVDHFDVQEALVDGTGNNLANPDWGSTDAQLLRLTSVEYADGVSTPAGTDRPSARVISNAVAAQVTTETNDRFLTDITWLWGQFVDHDIDLTENADPAEAFHIDVPTGDIYFDPANTGDVEIALNRSTYDPATGTSTENPRQQINQITAFLDGSVIYGSEQDRATELRTLEGGLLKTSDGDLLPFNEAGLPNAGGTSDALFLAGDIRANENAALTAMHTLWVREHNHWATELAAENPGLSDEELYRAARSIVTAELQAITFNEFLPALLGNGAISPYQGYDPSVDAGISNVFSTAAYRFGHSMLSSELLRLNDGGTTADEGNLLLQNAFFAPGEIVDNGIDSLLRGATAQVANEIDNQIVDDVRNFLFGAPGSGGFDLASLNIQRGRDHGLADYNQVREDLGLERVTQFSQITADPQLADRLEELYGDVDNIDAWVGALAEDHLPGSSVGELISTVLTDQFERMRDGDRLWYQNVFSGKRLAQIDNTSLSDVMQRNTDIVGLRDNVFFDESVLRIELADRGGPARLTLAVDASEVNLVNARKGDVLTSRSIDDVSQVQIIGSDRVGDHFAIDLSRAESTIPGGIVVYGGSHGRDVMDLFGTNGDDTVVVDGDRITVNGMVIDCTQVDLIRWHANGGEDELVKGEQGEARFIVVDRAPRPRGVAGRRDAPGPAAPRAQIGQRNASSAPAPGGPAVGLVSMAGRPAVRQANSPSPASENRGRTTGVASDEPAGAAIEAGPAAEQPRRGPAQADTRRPNPLPDTAEVVDQMFAQLGGTDPAETLAMQLDIHPRLSRG